MTLDTFIWDFEDIRLSGQLSFSQDAEGDKRRKSEVQVGGSHPAR